MNRDKAIIVLEIPKRNFSVDLEVPLDITANELIVALNSAYDLKIDTSNIKDCYLKASEPITLLRGNKTLAEFGVRNNTTISFTD